MAGSGDARAHNEVVADLLNNIILVIGLCRHCLDLFCAYSIGGEPGSLMGPECVWRGGGGGEDGWGKREIERQTETDMGQRQSGCKRMGGEGGVCKRERGNEKSEVPR